LVGVICAVNREDRDCVFAARDRGSLVEWGYQVALALRFVAVYTERMAQQRVFQELQFARRIQEQLLPRNPPPWGDYRIHAFCGPAKEVGGDFYDFIPIDDQRLMVVIADASGKGIPASMLMAMCRSFVWSSVDHFPGLQQFMHNLNQNLFRDTDPGHFVTMAVVILDAENHVCEYACGGHTKALIKLPDGKLRIIRPEGSAMGMLPDELGLQFDTIAFNVKPGTSMMLYTDGITEATDETDTEYGEDRLAAFWRNNNLTGETLAAAVLREVNAHTHDAPRSDDRTIVVIDRPASGSDQKQT